MPGPSCAPRSGPPTLGPFRWIFHPKIQLGLSTADETTQTRPDSDAQGHDVLNLTARPLGASHRGDGQQPGGIRHTPTGPAWSASRALPSRGRDGTARSAVGWCRSEGGVSPGARRSSAAAGGAGSRMTAGGTHGAPDAWRAPADDGQPPMRSDGPARFVRRSSRSRQRWPSAASTHRPWPGGSGCAG